jgi:F-type H+-transporting ATPase subunit delta
VVLLIRLGLVEVGGWTFDDSIETHLKRMNAELNRGAH